MFSTHRGYCRRITLLMLILFTGVVTIPIIRLASTGLGYPIQHLSFNTDSQNKLESTCDNILGV